MDKSQLEDIAKTLLALAAAYNATDAAALSQLFDIGKRFNEMLRDIRTQTEANAPEVWASVRHQWQESFAAFNAVPHVND